MSLKIINSYGYRTTAYYTLAFHQMLHPRWIANPDPWARTNASIQNRYEVNKEEIETALIAWERHPWWETCRKTQAPVELQVALDPPERLLEPNRLTFSEEQQEFDGIRTYRSPRLRSHIGVEARKIIREEMRSLENLAQALKYFGIDFNVRTNWKGEDRIINGLFLTIPKSDHQGNEEGHELKITADGITVNCGYVQQEQRYHQYEIEKAKKVLQGFDEETFESFEF